MVEEAASSISEVLNRKFTVSQTKNTLTFYFIFIKSDEVTFSKWEDIALPQGAKRGRTCISGWDQTQSERETHLKKHSCREMVPRRQAQNGDTARSLGRQEKFSCSEFVTTQRTSGDPGSAEGLNKRASLEGHGGQRGKTDFLYLRRIFSSFYPEKKLALEILASYKLSEEGLNKTELCHNNMEK